MEPNETATASRKDIEGNYHICMKRKNQIINYAYETNTAVEHHFPTAVFSRILSCKVPYYVLCTLKQNTAGRVSTVQYSMHNLVD